MGLSVIIPAYNVTNYINKTLESLLNQKSYGFEIIIIDDGSTDNTFQKAKDILVNSKIPYKILQKTNGGVSSARNYGLEEAEGEYVVFLDGDDYVAPNFAELVCNCIKNEQPDVICWGFNIVDEDNRVIMNYFDKYNISFESISGINLLKNMILEEKVKIWTGSVAYKKKFLFDNEFKYTEGCSNGEDQEFNLKVLVKAKKVFFINDTLSFYLQRPSSISNSSNIKKYDSINAMRRANEFMKNSLENKLELSEIVKHIEKYNIIGNYFFNIESHIKNSNLSNINILMKMIDDEFPDLNNEMKRMMYNSRKEFNRIAFYSNFFLISPSIFFHFIKFKKLLSANLRKK
ncbi:glycosyltransferase family 2 protein [Bacillus sp. FJAT-45066]|uniref:glycosyltransferase family 2 protein n=1 Tax=Bacillus sp. FJAT-45066 TaxID=2011010 RepID=UPI000BB6B4B1|nr:glycosyltransferase family A protein [Bacillus sp. FJAT-45066]